MVPRGSVSAAPSQEPELRGSTEAVEQAGRRPGPAGAVASTGLAGRDETAQVRGGRELTSCVTCKKRATCVCVCAWTPALICVHACTDVCVCVHIRIYTHTHTEDKRTIPNTHTKRHLGDGTRDFNLKNVSVFPTVNIHYFYAV